MIDMTNGSTPNTPNNNNGSNSGNRPGFGAHIGGGLSVNMATNNTQKNPILSKLINYNEEAKNSKFKPALFREKEIREVLAVLSMRDHPNCLLTGPAGIGKTAIPQELARRLVNGDPLVTKMLGKDTIIYELPLSNLVAGSSLAGQMEMILHQIIDFICDPKNHALLYLDEIHQLFKNNSGMYDTIAQILKPALARSDMHTIASTTTEEARFLKEDAAFSRRFTEVMLPEFTKGQMAQILIKLKSIYEKFHQMTFDDDIALPIVKVAHQYNSGKHDPDLTLSLIDRTMSSYQVQMTNLGMPSKNINIPYNVFKSSAKHILAPNYKANSIGNFGKLMQTQFIGQKDAQKTVDKILKMISLDLIDRQRPYSILFAGATGSGKTEMAKLMAKSLYGSTKSLIYLNMTEYSDDMSLSKLIGSSVGYAGSESARPLPLDSLTNNPYQIVLLDEFEKAAPNVKHVFMQALDEGQIETNHGNTINFSHAIIIATTNAGTHNEPTVGFTTQKDSAINDLKNDLPVELLNRFENIVEFDSLTKDQYKQILKIKYNVLSQRIFDHANIKLDPETLDLDKDYDFINNLADSTFDPHLNGRPAERSVMDYIENKILIQP